MTVVGTIDVIARIDTSQYKKAERDIDRSNDNVARSGERTSSRLNRGLTSVAKVGLAAVAAAAVAIGTLITRNVGSAIRRVDTLNNASRVFDNMGFSADQASKAMEGINSSIQGLPTTLDSAVRNVQLLAASTGDLDKSEKIFASLNNAIIGFGGSADMVENAMVQLSQAFSNGRVDAATWNSMINSGLGPALNALAKQAGITTGELKEGLSEGTISVEEFQDALIKMNKEGGGGMKSFERIAKDATSGIATGWTNMQTAISRGIAYVIEAIGPRNISGAISRLGSVMENFLKRSVDAVIEGFRILSDVGNRVANVFKTIWEFARPLRELLGRAFESTLKSLSNLFRSLARAMRPLVDAISQILRNEKVQEVLKGIGVALLAVIAAPVVAGLLALAAAVRAIGFAADVASRVVEFFSDTIRNISSWVSRNFGPALEKAGDAISSFSSSIGTAAKSVSDFVSDSVDYMKELPKNMKKFGEDAVKNVSDTFGNIGSTVSSTFNDMAAATVPWSQNFSGTLISTLNKATVDLNNYSQTTMSTWDSMFGNINSNMTTFRDDLLRLGSGVVSSFVDNFKNLPRSLSRIISRARSAAVKTFQGMLDNIQNIFIDAPSAVMDYFMGLGQGIIDFMSDIPAKIGQAITDIGKTISEFFSFGQGAQDGKNAGGDTIKNVADGAIEESKNIETIRKVGDAIVQFIAAISLAVGVYIVDAFGRMWNKIFEGIADIIPNAELGGETVGSAIQDGISKTFGGAFSKGKETVENFLSGIRNDLSNIYESGRTSIVNFFDGIGSFFRDIFESGKSAVNNFIDGVKDKYDDFFEAGKDVIRGFVDGMKSLLSDPVNTVVGMGNDILDGLKSRLGIHSPSREFKTVGEQMMEGLVIGINKGVKSVRGAMGNVSDATSFSANIPVVSAQRNAQQSFISPDSADSILSRSSSGSSNQVTVNQYNTINDNIDMNITTRYLTKELARS